MQRRQSIRSLALVALASSLSLLACGGESQTGSGGPGGTGGEGTTPGAGDPAGTGAGTGTGTDPAGGDPASNPNMVQRTVDYGEALRTASLKLTDRLPTLAQIKAIEGAADDAAKKVVYEGELDKMLADPAFAGRMVQWWRDTLKTGRGAGTVGAQGAPDYESAAVFAAQLVVQDKPYTDLFTATTGTCPTFANGTFTAAECAGTAPKAGILSNPGLMSQYFGNMAFRRVRFVQETFACTKFPAEYSATPVPMGASLYTGPWAFDSITGGTGARIDFKDTSSVICANCHVTMNHLAPLFANFNAVGAYNATTIQVETPVVTTVAAEKVTRLTDFLPAGQKTAWRNGVEVADLPGLGAAMAADPAIAQCAVNRVWNWAMSRGDIVNDLATVPETVTAPIADGFKANGFKMKKVIRDIFTSEDFVRF